jgi:hypothetical protein
MPKKTVSFKKAQNAATSTSTAMSNPELANKLSCKNFTFNQANKIASMITTCPTLIYLSIQLSSNLSLADPDASAFIALLQISTLQNLSFHTNNKNDLNILLKLLKTALAGNQTLNALSFAKMRKRYEYFNTENIELIADIIHHSAINELDLFECLSTTSAKQLIRDITFGPSVKKNFNLMIGNMMIGGRLIHHIVEEVVVEELLLNNPPAKDITNYFPNTTPMVNTLFEINRKQKNADTKLILAWITNEKTKQFTLGSSLNALRNSIYQLLEDNDSELANVVTCYTAYQTLLSYIPDALKTYLHFEKIKINEAGYAIVTMKASPIEILQALKIALKPLENFVFLSTVYISLSLLQIQTDQTSASTLLDTGTVTLKIKELQAYLTIYQKHLVTQANKSEENTDDAYQFDAATIKHNIAITFAKTYKEQILAILEGRAQHKAILLHPQKYLEKLASAENNLSNLIELGREIDIQYQRDKQNAMAIFSHATPETIKKFLEKIGTTDPKIIDNKAKSMLALLEAAQESLVKELLSIATTALPPKPVSAAHAMLSITNQPQPVQTDELKEHSSQKKTFNTKS